MTRTLVSDERCDTCGVGYYLPSVCDHCDAARPGSDSQQLRERIRQLERELAESILARDEARSRYTQVVLNRDALREGMEKLVKEVESLSPISAAKLRDMLK